MCPVPTANPDFVHRSAHAPSLCTRRRADCVPRNMNDGPVNGLLLTRPGLGPDRQIERRNRSSSSSPSSPSQLIHPAVRKEGLGSHCLCPRSIHLIRADRLVAQDGKAEEEDGCLIHASHVVDFSFKRQENSSPDSRLSVPTVFSTWFLPLTYPSSIQTCVPAPLISESRHQRKER